MERKYISIRCKHFKQRYLVNITNITISWGHTIKVTKIFHHLLRGYEKSECSCKICMVGIYMYVWIFRLVPHYLGCRKWRQGIWGSLWEHRPMDPACTLSPMSFCFLHPNFFSSALTSTDVGVGDHHQEQCLFTALIQRLKGIFVGVSVILRFWSPPFWGV